MKRISTRVGVFSTHVVPAMCFGALALMTIPAFADSRVNVFFAVVPLGFALVFFLTFSTFMWGLAEEVLDAGPFLVVRRSGQEERLLVSEIRSVSVMRSLHGTWVRVTLKLARPGRFGAEIAFRPRIDDAVDVLEAGGDIDSLTRRVDQPQPTRAERGI